MPSSRGRARLEGVDVDGHDRTRAPGHALQHVASHDRGRGCAPDRIEASASIPLGPDPVAGDREPGDAGDVDARATGGARVADRAWSPLTSERGT